MRTTLRPHRPPGQVSASWPESSSARAATSRFTEVTAAPCSPTSLARCTLHRGALSASTPTKHHLSTLGARIRTDRRGRDHRRRQRRPPLTATQAWSPCSTTSGVTAEIRDTGCSKTITATVANRPGWVLEFSDGEGGLPYTEDGLMVVVELLDRREPDCPDDAVSNASRVLLEASTAGVVMDPPGAEEPDILKYIDELVRGMAAQDTPAPAAEPQQPEPVQDEPVISITVTRSAGSDGAFVVQIDPGETGVLSAEGGPGLRVYLREATVFSDRDFAPYRYGRQTSGRVCASRYLDVAAVEVDYVEGPPRILSRHQRDTGVPCRWSCCTVTPQATGCPDGCSTAVIHEMS